MFNDKKRSRLHIRSIKDAVVNIAELPPDEEIAELFREMRQATGQSQGQMADQLGTTVEIISLLELGHLSLLPPWTETSRIIRAYTKLLGLDADPVMRRVMLQLPGDHPKRPRTQEIDPSYTNMQANAEAVMNRIPVNQAAVEAPFVPMQAPPQPFAGGQAGPGGQAGTSGLGGPGQPGENGNYAPDYGQMRAIPPGYGNLAQKSRRQGVAKPRKNGVFVAFVQLLLLLIMLGAGYVIWLAINDPQGYEQLKTLVLTRAAEGQKILVVYLQSLMTYIQGLLT
ncbi:MAG: helix-turn-helix domain-containing protein [Hyphomicrobiaceae bacterium]|nr:helix-turn-helix domain-containing protein [Hyphomicrobiaceae bacterium]